MMEHPDHCFFWNSKDGALGDRGRRGHAQRLAGEASFTKKISAAQDGDDRFFPACGENRQLDFTLLNVKHGIGGTALREDDLVLSMLLGDPSPDFAKVRLELE